MADNFIRGIGCFDVESNPAGAEIFEGRERSGGIYDHKMGFPFDFDGDTGEVFVGNAYGRHESSVHEIELDVTGEFLDLRYHGAQRFRISGENSGNYAGNHAVILKGVG